MGPRDIALEVQGGAMVEKTWTDGEEMITMGESALTVQIDIETLEKFLVASQTIDDGLKFLSLDGIATCENTSCD